MVKNLDKNTEETKVAPEELKNKKKKKEEVQLKEEVKKEAAAKKVKEKGAKLSLKENKEKKVLKKKVKKAKRKRKFSAGKVASTSAVSGTVMGPAFSGARDVGGGGVVGQDNMVDVTSGVAENNVGDASVADLTARKKGVVGELSAYRESKPMSGKEKVAAGAGGVVASAGLVVSVLAMANVINLSVIALLAITASIAAVAGGFMLAAVVFGRREREPDEVEKELMRQQTALEQEIEKAQEREREKRGGKNEGIFQDRVINVTESERGR